MRQKRGFPSGAFKRATRCAARLTLCAPPPKRQVEHLGRLADDLLDEPLRRPSDAQYGGLGIGLALVQTLVTLHGGSVAARSEGLLRGSQFDIELPLAPADDVSPTNQTRSHQRFVPTTRPRRILVVDDNVDSGDMLGEALMLAGHEVRVLHDLFAAATAVADLAADVVVLDLGMPGRDGYSVAADIQDRFGAFARGAHWSWPVERPCEDRPMNAAGDLSPDQLQPEKEEQRAAEAATEE